MIYRCEIRSLTTGNTYSIGSQQSDSLALQTLSLNYSYLTYGNPCSLRARGLVSRAFSYKTIHSGDVIVVYENDVRIFIGYILSVGFSYSASNATLSLSFNTLLSQWGKQKMISTSADVSGRLTPSQQVDALIEGSLTTLQPDTKPSELNSNFSVGRKTLGELVSFMVNGSVFQYARDIYEGGPFSKLQIIYEYPDILNRNTSVYYYPLVNATKRTVMDGVIYPYQHLLYQDPSGNVRFSLPSFSNTSNLDVNQDSSGFIQYTETEAEVDVVNYLVFSFMATGVFPTYVDPGELMLSISTPNATYFPGLERLLKSGFYTQSEVEYNQLGADLIRDAALLNALTEINKRSDLNVTTNTASSGSKLNSTANLFSANALARELVNARHNMIRLRRSPSFTEIPIGKVIRAFDSTWLVTHANITLEAVGDGFQNVLTLQGSIPTSASGGWQP